MLWPRLKSGECRITWFYGRNGLSNTIRLCTFWCQFFICPGLMDEKTQSAVYMVLTSVVCHVHQPEEVRLICIS